MQEQSESGDNTGGSLAGLAWCDISIRCVLSCPVALEKWEELAGYLGMEDEAVKFANSGPVTDPHVPCRRILELWFESKANKEYAIQDLMDVLQVLQATYAYGRYLCIA